jgi:hypothetical protein
LGMSQMEQEKTVERQPDLIMTGLYCKCSRYSVLRRTIIGTNFTIMHSTYRKPGCEQKELT